MTSDEVVQCILKHDASVAGDASVEATAETLERSYLRLVDVLERSMGAAGCAELITRAYARAAETNPILKILREGSGDCTRLAGIASSVDRHGREPVTAAIAALLTAVIDILTRLLGEEMTTQLVTGDDAQPATQAGGVA